MRTRLQARRERNRELAQQDRANRCAECKLDLLKQAEWVVQSVLYPEKRFCSTGCVDQWTARQAGTR